MGYALNLCKSHIYNVPYNHNIAEEGMKMTQNRVRIVDDAEYKTEIVLPVALIKRESTRKL